MVYPMMLKIDFGSIVAVRERPRGILVTLFVNWLVKPFSMAAIGYLFFRVLFQPWIGAELANQYSPARSSSPPRRARRWSSSGRT